jgi:hypothetical protein
MDESVDSKSLCKSFQCRGPINYMHTFVGYVIILGWSKDFLSSQGLYQNRHFFEVFQKTQNQWLGTLFWISLETQNYRLLHFGHVQNPRTEGYNKVIKEPHPTTLVHMHSTDLIFPAMWWQSFLSLKEVHSRLLGSQHFN